MRKANGCAARHTRHVSGVGPIDQLIFGLHDSVRSTVSGVTMHGLCIDATTGWLDRHCRLYVLRIIKQHSVVVGGQTKYLLRFAANNVFLGAEFPLFEALKIKAYEQFPNGIGSPPLKLAEVNGEVTVHEDESRAFAPWVVKWLDARVTGAVLPVPPFPLMTQFDLGNNYQYSMAAKAAYDQSRGVSAR